MYRRPIASIAVTLLLSLVACPVFSQAVTPAISVVRKPSRAADAGCKWENISGAGLTLWVERCDYGSRKIDFLFKGNALVQRSSDGGVPDTVIDVIDLLPAETHLAAIQRVLASHTKPAVAKKCVVVPFKNGGRPPAGTAFYTFQPNAAYEKTLAKVKSGDVPDPPCGDWGFAPDGIQYFEVWPASGARKILFVRVGQDTPLFDERTLAIKS